MKQKTTDEIFHKIINQRNLRKEAIDALAEKYQPKIIRQYNENGHQISVIEAAYADGANNCQYIKPTGRSGEYEL